MVFFAAMFLAGFILAGLLLVANGLDRISKQMSRANDLKEAELRSNGKAVAAPSATPD
jgi:hypothetical protein